MATVEAAVVTKGATVSVVIRTTWKVANAVGEKVVIASVAMGMMTTITTKIGSFGGAGRVAASCIKWEEKRPSFLANKFLAQNRS